MQRDQFSRQGGQMIVVAFGEAISQIHVAAFDIAKFGKCARKCTKKVARIGLARACQAADQPSLSQRLGTDADRMGCRYPRKHADKVPPANHSIT